MALGKNMKVEKLIPLVPKEKTEEKSTVKVKPISLVEEMPLSTIESDAVAVEQNAEAPTNVDLDSFFEGLEAENTVEEVSSVVEEISVESSTVPLVEEVQSKMPVSNEISEELKEVTYVDVDTESLKIVFKPSRRKTQKRIFIDIEGAMTINNVDVLYSKVNDVFSSFDHVELNLANITEIDLTVIQLFHTIRMSYYPLKKYIYINATFAREERKLLNASGFTEFQTQKPASI
jgi:hypothetical protein